MGMVPVVIGMKVAKKMTMNDENKYMYENNRDSKN